MISIFVGAPRRDGKLPVRVTYSNGKELRKLWTRDFLDSYVAQCRKSDLTVEIFV